MAGAEAGTVTLAEAEAEIVATAGGRDEARA